MENPKAPPQPQPKKVYSPPVLREYGNVNEVTLGGPGARSELRGKSHP